MRTTYGVAAGRDDIAWPVRGADRVGRVAIIEPEGQAVRYAASGPALERAAAA